MAVIVVLLVILLVLFTRKGSGGGTLTTGGASPTSSSSIEDLMQAIFTHEGPGLRDANNNPGNLKPPDGSPNFWTGQVGTDASGFAIFSDIGDGWDALRTDITAALHRDPTQSIEQFFQRYSPDGTSDAYAQSVAEYLGVDPQTPLVTVAGG